LAQALFGAEPVSVQRFYNVQTATASHHKWQRQQWR